MPSPSTPIAPNVWVTASETLATRWAFRDLFEKRAVSVCMFDVGWTGGLSESKKIATMAEAYQLPVAPHDCTGPILLTASVHLSMNCPNTLVQEVVRAFYFDWYGKLVTQLPPLDKGYITAPQGRAGHEAAARRAQAQGCAHPPQQLVAIPDANRRPSTPVGFNPPRRRRHGTIFAEAVQAALRGRGGNVHQLLLPAPARARQGCPDHALLGRSLA